MFGPPTVRDHGTVTVSMPYYGCPRTLHRAVTSVLEQDYTNLHLVITNDGGGDGAWPPIADIDDPRVTRFNLPTNRGRYYADAVVLSACQTPWFAIHDADDWADPQWISDLVETAYGEGTLAAFAPQVVHAAGRRRTEQVHPLLRTLRPIPQMTHLAHHAGVYRTQTLRTAGGYHPGYRVGYDTLLVNLVRMIAPVSVSPHPRYHRCIRLGSLTTAKQTGFGSPERNAVRLRLQDLYRRALATDPSDLRRLIEDTIPVDIAESVRGDANRLMAQWYA